MKQPDELETHLIGYKNETFETLKDIFVYIWANQLQELNHFSHNRFQISLQGFYFNLQSSSPISLAIIGLFCIVSLTEVAYESWSAKLEKPSDQLRLIDHICLTIQLAFKYACLRKLHRPSRSSISHSTRSPMPSIRHVTTQNNKVATMHFTALSRRIFWYFMHRFFATVNVNVCFGKVQHCCSCVTISKIDNSFIELQFKLQRKRQWTLFIIIEWENVNFSLENRFGIRMIKPSFANTYPEYRQLSLVFVQFNSSTINKRGACALRPEDGLALDKVIHWGIRLCLLLIMFQCPAIYTHSNLQHIFGINSGQNAPTESFATRLLLLQRHRLILDYLEIGELMTKHSEANKFCVWRRALASFLFIHSPAKFQYKIYSFDTVERVVRFLSVCRVDYTARWRSRTMQVARRMRRQPQTVIDWIDFAFRTEWPARLSQTLTRHGEEISRPLTLTITCSIFWICWVIGC